MFVLGDDVKSPGFYKALSLFTRKSENRKPLISFGVLDLDSIEAYVPVYYLDSSIWNYYLNVLDNKEKRRNNDKGLARESGNSIFTKKLADIIVSILTNYTKQLYNLTVAKEFIEFQSRLLGNSYLGLPGGHAADIAPFIFHSESLMKLKVETIKEDIKELYKSGSNKNNPAIKWNILLLDDYSNKPLRGGKQNKKQILEQLLETIKDKTNFIFNIEDVSSINEAITKIKNNEKKDDVKNKKQYDIILLDYLLGQKNGDKNSREYGDEFLRKLKYDEELLKRRGPLGKFWIFPISSFSNAMLSKLEEEGIGRISDIWYIMDGADMINTPSLFVYNFLQLIYLQLNTAIVTVEDIIKFIIDNITDDSSISHKTVSTSNEDVYGIRQRARRLYGIFMHRFGLRGALKNDEKQGSVFAESVLEYMFSERPDDLKFYENVRKLLYLVGYATHSDSALMWDLLTHISSVVASTKFESEEINKDHVNSFLQMVRDYISELRHDHG